MLKQRLDSLKNHRKGVKFCEAVPRKIQYRYLKMKYICICCELQAAGKHSTAIDVFVLATAVNDNNG